MAQDGGTRHSPVAETAGPTAAAYLELAAELARTEGRHLLDLATGVLVAQQAVDPVVAAESLAAMAGGAGLGVADLAADIVNAACGQPAVEAAEVAGADGTALPGPRARRQAASAAEVGGDVDEVAETLLGALRPAGVRGLLVWRRTAGDCLRLVGSAGFSPLVAAQWAQIPPQWRALPQRVFTDDTPLWLAHGVDDPDDLPGPRRDAARALLPLRHGGYAAGVVLVAWREPTDLDTDLRRRVVSLTEVLARVLTGLQHVTDPGASLPVLSAALDLMAEPAMTLRRSRAAPRRDSTTDERRGTVEPNGHGPGGPGPRGEGSGRQEPGERGSGSDEAARLGSGAHGPGGPGPRGEGSGGHQLGERGSGGNEAVRNGSGAHGPGGPGPRGEGSGRREPGERGSGSDEAVRNGSGAHGPGGPGPRGEGSGRQEPGERGSGGNEAVRNGSGAHGPTGPGSRGEGPDGAAPGGEVAGRGGAGEEAAALYVEHLNAAAQRMSSGVPRPVGRPLAHVLPAVAGELAELVADVYRHGAVQHAPRLPAVRRPDVPPLLNVRVLAVSAERCVVLWHAEERDHSFAVLKRAGRLGSLAAFEDDIARGVTEWSEHVAPLLGLPGDAEPIPLERVATLLVAEDRSELGRMMESLTARLEGVSGVVRIARPDGGVRHVRLIAEPLLTHGTLTGLTGFFQDVSAQHQTEAALAATFDTLGTVQEQAALRHRLALQLQQAIVPEQSDLGGLPGLQVAARYRPAAEEYRVGGDWYDALGLPDGRVMIAVGDVAGHGIDAATGMVALRNALRGLACSGGEPGELMRALNEVALRTNGHPTATAVCAHFDPADRTLHWTSAGHLPPLLLREGRARYLQSATNLLLGAVPEIGYQESQVALRRGDLLLLCTDGLIERRHSSLDEALTLLAETVVALDPADDLEAQADALLAAAHGDTHDDASLVLVRLG